MLPSTAELLQQFGERLRLARRRRRLAAKEVAQRAGMTPMTLRSLELGGAGVTMGAYLSVMQVLGIEKDLGLLGAADPLGRELQDARLNAPGRPAGRIALNDPVQLPSRKRRITTTEAVRNPLPDDNQHRLNPDAPGDFEQWGEKQGFSSSQALLGLLDAHAVPKTGR